MDSITTDVIENYSEFSELKPEWDDLFERSTDQFPMISHSWLSAWWEAFGDSRSLHIVTCRLNGKLVFCAPLCLYKVKYFGIPIASIEYIANERVDRMQFLFDKALYESDKHTIFEEFYNALFKVNRWGVIKLKNLEKSSPLTIEFIDFLDQKNHLQIINDQLQSPYSKLPKDWDTFLAGLSPSFRQTVRRKLKKALKSDQVYMKTYTGQDFIEPLMQVSKNTWQHAQGTCMGSKTHIKQFYEKIITDADKSGSLYSAILFSDDTPIAFEFNLTCGETLYNFKLGFDSRFSDLSAGMVLKALFIQELLSDNSKIKVNEYDYMGASGGYKLNWADEIRGHVTISLYRRRPLPFFIFIARTKLSPMIKKTLKKSKNIFNRRQNAGKLVDQQT